MKILPLEIYQAKKKNFFIRDTHSACEPHALSERCNSEIWCKLEIMQPTCAFKLRSATNAILRFYEDQRKCGVVGVTMEKDPAMVLSLKAVKPV